MALCGLTELMKPHHPLGLSQAILYMVSVFLGLLVAIPMGVTMRNFHGQCVLFAELVWDGSTIYPWSKTSCNFTLYIHIGLSIIYALLMAIMTLLTVTPRTLRSKEKFGVIQWTNSNYFIQALNPFFTFFNTLLTVVMLASAIVLTTGFAQFCMDMERTLKQLDRPMKCYKAQDMDWSKVRIIGGTTHGVNGDTFHICLSIAVVASWGLVVTWFIQTLLNFSQSCRGCSCAIAEEKKKISKSMMVAHRRSRRATPIGTPGNMTPTHGYPPGMVPLRQAQPPHGYPHQPIPPKV